MELFVKGWEDARPAIAGAHRVVATVLVALIAGVCAAASGDEVGGPYVVVIGAPGAGKSTVSAYISDSMGVPVIEVGRMLQDELSAAVQTTYAGRPGTRRSAAWAAHRRAIEAAKDKLEAGLLVDDRAIDGAVAVGVMGEAASGGFVLDGYPGSLDQAQFLDSLLAPRGVEPIVIFLEVSDDVALERMKSRGRVDDTHGIPEQRLETFRKNVQPVLEYYEDAGLYRIDASKSIPEVLKQVEKVIPGRRAGSGSAPQG